MEIVVILLATALMIYSLYFLCKQSAAKTWLFLLTLIGVLALSLMIPDIIFKWQRSGMSRYLIPSYLGIEIAIAYVISKKLASQYIWRQRLWSGVIFILISSGIISCVWSSQSEGWWNKIQSYSVTPIARTINAVDHPLVISDSKIGNIMPLAWILDSDVNMQLLVKAKIPVIPDKFNHVFLYKPSKGMEENLKENYTIEKFQNFNNLKSLTKK